MSEIKSLDGSRRGSGYNLSKMPSVKSMGSGAGEGSPFVPQGLTSEVYGVDNPPKDWADIGLLIPHEAIRHEMTAMVASAKALKADGDASEAWRVLYFAEWYVDIFAPVIHR